MKQTVDVSDTLFDTTISKQKCNYLLIYFHFSSFDVSYMLSIFPLGKIPTSWNNYPALYAVGFHKHGANAGNIYNKQGCR